MSRTLAVYDFDNTLIHGDSLWLFVCVARTWIGAAATILLGTGWALLTVEFYRDPKTAIKRRWLRLALNGLTLDAAAKAALQVKARVRWNGATVKTLEKHAAEGADIVIATGALDIYIGTVVEGVPYHLILCTVMEKKDGRLTGRLMTPNTVREEKARLVAAYIDQRGPFSHISGYGNLPSDRQMLNLCTDSFVI